MVVVVHEIAHVGCSAMVVVGAVLATVESDVVDFGIFFLPAMLATAVSGTVALVVSLNHLASAACNSPSASGILTMFDGGVTTAGLGACTNVGLT